MKIAILSRGSKLYSTRRLLEAAHQRDHEVKIVDTLRCYMNMATAKPSISYRGERLDDFDAVIPRIGASITFYGTAVVRQFEMMGVYAVNESVAIARSSDKLRSCNCSRAGTLACPSRVSRIPRTTSRISSTWSGARHSS